MTEPTKKYLKNFIKLAIVGGLLYVLTKKGFLSLEATSRAFQRLDLLLSAYGVLLLTTVLCITRWRWLLGAQGIALTWWRTFQLTFIGIFFNLALPGAVSGDFVKAFYIAREVQGNIRARAFGSILFDRVAGLSALVLVAAGALIIGAVQDHGLGQLNALVAMVVGCAAVVVAFYSYLFLVKEHHDPLLRAFRALEAKFARAGSLTRIYIGLREYHNHRWIVMKVLFVSVLVHLTCGMSFILMAKALGEDVAALSVFVVVPIGLLATAIPIAPAGVGTGHLAFGWLFHFLGSQRGADLFSLYVLNQLIGGAIGGLVYLRFRAHEPKPTADAVTAAG